MFRIISEEIKYDPSGKDIFEAKYIDATFDPKTRMYK